ncbi:Putative S-adenosyl-L-methionine-dependent methyltransferase [Kitasatospora sp. MMS16-BH015]|uniref:SAM-dependent methyltransferase n=1 Tax=Kitasatospora sp. MMS16-BH015 TaxID=2018025 RepID=UPI000CA18DE1|nr:SAM-dependent methyltransferase [Kitasatospora sp. MMS16-BH015]AUG80684.1 Putative S-adenosyl-L-methionine-dependent methyltransferase [Kitasatospora sp. MMS16-BH015]
MEAVSRTAQWTAAARALESERESPLFVDPYARTVAAEVGFQLLERYAGAGTVEFLAIRTTYLDRAIGQAVAEQGLRQIVFVASGMDTRPYRLTWPEGVTVFELDRPALLAAKAELLAGAELPAGVERRPVAVDLAGEWLGSLVEAGWQGGEPTLWVVEGLLFFLPEDAVRRLLGTICERTADGSVLLGDVASRVSLQNKLAGSFLNALKEDDSAWLFGTDEPEKFLAECGWIVREVKQPGEEGAAFGRWPYPVVAREVPRVPRSFLFTLDVPQR